MRYPIVIEAGPGNWSSFAPDVHGCVVTGKTIPETVASMAEALEFHLQAIIDDGDQLPVPCSVPIINLSPEDEVHFVDVRLHQPAIK